MFAYKRFFYPDIFLYYLECNLLAYKSFFSLISFVFSCMQSICLQKSFLPWHLSSFSRMPSIWLQKFSWRDIFLCFLVCNLFAYKSFCNLMSFFFFLHAIYLVTKAFLPWYLSLFSRMQSIWLQNPDIFLYFLVCNLFAYKIFFTSASFFIFLYAMYLLTKIFLLWHLSFFSRIQSICLQKLFLPGYLSLFSSMQSICL